MLSDLFEQLVSIQMKTTQGSDGQAYCTWPDAPEGYSYALWGKSKTNTGTGLLATHDGSKSAFGCRLCHSTYSERSLFHVNCTALFSHNLRAIKVVNQ